MLTQSTIRAKNATEKMGKQKQNIAENGGDRQVG